MKHFLLTISLLPCLLLAQTSITDQNFQDWLAAKVDFITFDVRGDANPDSIAYPSFYTLDAKKWVDSINCRKRLLIYCHAGVFAMSTAQQIVAAGYPADSVYASGYDVLVSSRFPSADTLPLSLLDQSTALPGSLTPYQLQSIILSRRDYLLIDVRSTGETASGMIPGACNIVWPDQFKADTARMGRSQQIILNCASGTRAGQARDYLIKQGYDPNLIVNFGRFSKWQQAFYTQVITPSPKCACAAILDISTASGPGYRILEPVMQPYIMYNAQGRAFHLTQPSSHTGGIVPVNNYKIYYNKSHKAK